MLDKEKLKYIFDAIEPYYVSKLNNLTYEISQGIFQEAGIEAKYDLID